MAPLVSFVAVLVVWAVLPWAANDIYDDDLNVVATGLVLAAVIGLAAPTWTAIVCRRRGVTLIDGVVVTVVSGVATLALFVFGPYLLWSLSCNLSGDRCT